MSLFKDLLLKFYTNYVFKHYYILYQNVKWKFRKLIIKPYLKLIKLHYNKYNPSKYLFKSIQIQTQTYCNLNCQFCPNNKIKREHGEMTLKLYNDIINQLSVIKYSGEILLYLHCEPLLEKRMPKLIKIARKKCPNAVIGLFSNGTQLTNNLMNELFNSGLSFLRINDYTMVQEKIHKIKEIYDIKSKIMNFVSYPKYKDRIKIFTYFQNIRKMSNRSGLMEGIGIPTPLNLFCNRPFEQLYINFKGEALFCCNDWLFKEKIGQLSKNSIFEIWQNARYNKLRCELLNNKRKGICTECDYTSALFPSIIFLNFINKILPFEITLKKKP